MILLVHSWCAMMFSYIGPETILPASSLLAAIAGTALVFWNSICRAAGWFFGSFRRK